MINGWLMDIPWLYGILISVTLWKICNMEVSIVMGVPNSWLVYFMENPNLKWMITKGTPMVSNLHMEKNGGFGGKSVCQIMAKFVGDKIQRVKWRLQPAERWKSLSHDWYGIGEWGISHMSLEWTNTTRLDLSELRYATICGNFNRKWCVFDHEVSMFIQPQIVDTPSVVGFLRGVEFLGNRKLGTLDRLRTWVVDEVLDWCFFGKSSSAVGVFWLVVP